MDRDGRMVVGPASFARSPRKPWMPMLATIGFALTLAACAAEPQAASVDTEPAPAADRRVVLVTGSTNGLGQAVALELAATGAHVIVHGRNAEAGMEIVREIAEDGVGAARFYQADFGSLDQVRDFADAILRDYDRLDVLINNAGLGRGPDETRRDLSMDGHELRFQVNYLAGYLLTRKLLPLIVATPQSRIINVASGANATVDFDNVMLEREYNGARAYGQSKHAQILFTYDLAEELEGTGVTVATLHPATLMPTRMVLETGREPASTIDDGAEAVLNLVESPDIVSGQYYNGLRPARAPNDQAYDVEARARLRQLAEELTGI